MVLDKFENVICFFVKFCNEPFISNSAIFLKFRNKIIIKKPTQNSKPAKAKKKNVKEIKFRSSLREPK